eukprot:11163245-Lingulodinium_polyedra.AAC.1
MASQIKTWNWQKLRVMFRLRRAPWDEGHSGYCIRTASWLAKLHGRLDMDDLLTRALVRYHDFAARIFEAPSMGESRPLVDVVSWRSEKEWREVSDALRLVDPNNST